MNHPRQITLAKEIVSFSKKVQKAVEQDKNYVVPAKILISIIRELDYLGKNELGILDEIVLSRFKSN